VRTSKVGGLLVIHFERFKTSWFPSACVTQVDIQAVILQKKLWLEFGCLIAFFTFNYSSVSLVTSRLIFNGIRFFYFSMNS